MSSVERLLELCWRDVAEGAVEPLGVEPVDPSEGGEFDGVDVAPWSLSVDQFVLVKTVHGLGEGVIVGLSGQSEIGSPGGPG